MAAKLLGAGPQTRAGLVRRLRLGIRGFYRDLEVLRDIGIIVHLAKGKYFLEENADTAIERLPFPIRSCRSARPARAKGRGPVHKKLKALLEQIEKVTPYFLSGNSAMRRLRKLRSVVGSCP